MTRATPFQIVGRFVFENTAAVRNRALRPQARTAQQGGDWAATFAFLLAIAITTAALWRLGF